MKASESSEELSHLVELRRWFHQHAELSFHEVETAQRIMAELDRLKIPYSYGGEGGGIIARQISADDAPTVALRAEMDALPGEETTGADYASVFAGAMHVCGHDAHMAMVLGAAALLKKSPPAGNVVYIFQPAEERGGGSRKMISAGALEHVQAIYAGHVSHEFTLGRIMVAEGVVTAQSDRFVINVRGQGGHGARPHETTDAVVIAGFLIMALQTLVSREINPLHPSVVTIGQVHSGTAANVIAEEAMLEGTIRTTRADVRRHIHDGIRRMAEAAGLLHDASISVEIQKGISSGRQFKSGGPGGTGRSLQSSGGIRVSLQCSTPVWDPKIFPIISMRYPGCFVRFGARHPDWEPVPLHSPGFDIDERVLPIGARFFEQVARDSLDTQSARDD